jgi:oligopeptide transport system substrate-binding protein
MRLRRRGYRIAASAVAGMLVLSGCGGSGGDDDGDTEASASEESASPKPSDDKDDREQKGEIVVRGCEPQNPLIPTNTSETCGGNILDQVLAKLVKYDSDDGHAEMDVAESIETDDSIKYTVKLKRDVKFHDGTKVTADSFIDAWNWGAYGPNAQLNSYFFEPIKGYKDLQSKDEKTKPKKKEMTGLKKVNDYEFTVTMAEKTSTFAQRLGYTAFAPLPKSFFEDNGKAFGKKPIGAGAFKLVEADPNKQFVLEADEDYDRVGRPSIKKVTFKVFKESDAAYKELQDDKIDLTDEIPTVNLVDDLYKEDLEDRTMERTVGVFQAINFPSPKADKSYENPKLRQAISMAIDRELIIEKVFNNTREPATGWVSPVVDGFEAGACAEFCEYNKEQAKKLFDEVDGFKGPITIAYNGDASHKDWVDAACTSISEALEVECLGKATPTFAEFRKNITERKQKGLFRAGWQMDYPSIENFLVPLYATGGSSNDGDYSNKAFDRKLKDAAAETDPVEVNKLYAEAEQMLKNDMPSIPMWYSKAIGGYSKNIKSAKFTVFGTYDLGSIELK